MVAWNEDTPFDPTGTTCDVVSFENEVLDQKQVIALRNNAIFRFDRRL